MFLVNHGLFFSLPGLLTFIFVYFLRFAICTNMCVLVMFFFFLFTCDMTALVHWQKLEKDIKTNRTVFHPWLIFFLLYLLRSFSLLSFPLSHSLSLSLSLSVSAYKLSTSLMSSHGSRLSSSIFFSILYITLQ